jgi:hypothetical protein
LVAVDSFTQHDEVDDEKTAEDDNRNPDAE